MTAGQFKNWPHLWRNKIHQGRLAGTESAFGHDMENHDKGNLVEEDLKGDYREGTAWRTKPRRHEIAWQFQSRHKECYDCATKCDAGVTEEALAIIMAWARGRS